VAVTTMALYVRPGHTMADTVLITAILAVINIPVMLLWAGFGVGMRDMLRVPARIRIFNIGMGLLLAASVMALVRL
jgi:threonine/homoserine/homoserine lactone efflux protein